MSTLHDIPHGLTDAMHAKLRFEMIVPAYVWSDQLVPRSDLIPTPCSLHIASMTPDAIKCKDFFLCEVHLCIESPPACAWVSEKH
jgi:hypothetical protein